MRLRTLTSIMFALLLALCPPGRLDGQTAVVSPHSATHPPHSHKEDEFFFILEGTAECILGGERRTVGPYSSFYCPSAVEHGIRNVGDTELKYLVVKRYGSSR